LILSECRIAQSQELRIHEVNGASRKYFSFVADAGANYDALGVGIFDTRNTIMTIRKFLLTAASLAALSPAISNAAPEDTALKACAQAYASSLATGSGTPTFKLKYQSEFTGTLAYYGSHDYTFDLQARNPKTGLVLGRATCSADIRGTISALTATPLEASSALAAPR
jgi:hypothetical protein